MHRWVEQSNDTEPLPPRPLCRDCIIATCGYDFRKGQVTATSLSQFFIASWSALTEGEWKAYAALLALPASQRLQREHNLASLSPQYVFVATKTV
jgi:hypothetical protein